MLASGTGPATPIRGWTSGDIDTFTSLVEKLDTPKFEVQQAFWKDGELSLP